MVSEKLFKPNVSKCNLITTTMSQGEIQIGETFLASKNRIKLLGIHFLRAIKLWLSLHFIQLCKQKITRFD